MSWTRAASGTLGGVLLAAGILALLRESVPSLSSAFQLLDVNQARWPMVLLIVGGVVLGMLLVVVRKQPVVTGVAGVIVLGPYVPLIFDFRLPDWYPNWLAELVIFTAGAEPLFVGGILIGSAAWTAFRRGLNNPGLIGTPAALRA